MYLILCNYLYIEGLATQYTLYRLETAGLACLLPLVFSKADPRWRCVCLP